MALQKPLGRKMRRAADADRGVVELAGARMHVGDKLGKRVHRQLEVDEQRLVELGQQRDRREAIGIVRQTRMQKRVDRDGCIRPDQQRVSVGRCLGCGLRRDDGVGADFVLDDERLAECVAQVLRDVTR